MSGCEACHSAVPEVEQCHRSGPRSDPQQVEQGVCRLDSTGGGVAALGDLSEQTARRDNERRCGKADPRPHSDTDQDRGDCPEPEVDERVIADAPSFECVAGLPVGVESVRQLACKIAEQDAKHSWGSVGQQKGHIGQHCAESEDRNECPQPEGCSVFHSAIVAPFVALSTARDPLVTFGRRLSELACSAVTQGASIVRL